VTTQERISASLDKAAGCLDAAKEASDPAVADALTRQAGVWVQIAEASAVHAL
jgi:hypothetical protein